LASYDPSGGANLFSNILEKLKPFAPSDFSALSVDPNKDSLNLADELDLSFLCEIMYPKMGCPAIEFPT
jgi:hypothetical protein